MESMEDIVRRIVKEELAAAERVRPRTARSSSVAHRRLFTVSAAAEYCGLAVQTLYNLKHDGLGPKAHKHGRLTVYYPSDLDAWLEDRLAVDDDIARRKEGEAGSVPELDPTD
jgi:predicted DNA-binding transcriptional regulator AlpA